MGNKYIINKGINKPIEFKGLKAQYIAYMAFGMLLLLILFAVLFILGVPVYICLICVGGAGTALFIIVTRYSNKHGVHGLLKEGAWRATPTVLRCRRRLFEKKKERSQRAINLCNGL